MSNQHGWNSKDIIQNKKQTTPFVGYEPQIIPLVIWHSWQSKKPEMTTVYRSVVSRKTSTNPNFLVPLTFGFITQLLVVLFHQSSYLSVWRLSRVVLLMPDVWLARTVALPVCIERTNHLHTAAHVTSRSYTTQEIMQKKNKTLLVLTSGDQLAYPWLVRTAY